MKNIAKWILNFCLLIFLSSAFASNDSLTNVYDSAEKQYSIHYPATWQYKDLGKGAVVFVEINGKKPHLTSINIQTIFTKKAHGTYPTIKALMDDFWSQVPKHADQAKLYDRKPITLVEPDGTKLTGEQTTLTFKEYGVTFKQWQIMVMTNDGILFQAWAYRAPIQDYDANLKLAESMLATWVIN